MKLRLKSSVFFVPTDEGIYFAGPSGRHLVRGDAVYQYFQALRSYLDGTWELDEIYQRFGSAKATTERFVTMLQQWDFLTLVGEQSELIPVADDFSSVRQYLNDFSPQPSKAWDRIQSASIVLVVSDDVVEDLFHALTQTGFPAPLSGTASQGDRVDLVIAHPHLAKEWSSPVLFLGHNAGSIYVGPIAGRGQSLAVHQVNNHLVMSHLGAWEQGSKVARRVASHLVAYEALKLLGGIPPYSNSCQSGVFEITEDLQTVFHLFSVPSADNISRVPVSWKMPDENVAPSVTDAMVHKLQTLVDPVVGIVAYLEERERLPLPLCRVSGPHSREPITVGARTSALSLQYAMRASIALYYARLDDGPSKNNFVTCDTHPTHALAQALMTWLEGSETTLEEVRDHSLSEYATYLLELISHVDSARIKYGCVLKLFFLVEIKLDNMSVRACSHRLETAIETALERMWIQVTTGRAWSIHGVPLFMPPVPSHDALTAVDDCVQKGLIQFTASEYSVKLLEESGLHVYNILVGC